MSFKFKRKDRSIQHAVRRIAREQIDKAIETAEDKSIDSEERIHAVRKRCKKMRGLVRVVRPEFDGYEKANATLRDAARRLAVSRDATVQIETLDDLKAEGDTGEAHEVSEAAYRSKRLELEARKSEAEAGSDPEQLLSEFVSEMKRLRRAVKRWRIDEDGFAAIEGGLTKTYRRMRSAMHEARENPSTETMHEWRKRAKYHWYHVSLLRDAAPAMLKARASALKDLGDLLGDHHDIAIFRSMLDTEDEQDALLERTAKERQSQLEATAFELGQQLAIESPSTLRKRFEGFWGLMKD
ncbi:CHAD domain-containing protein [Devosia pacifica]|uniref:CHAD domain-containing protein n=1 Tax=Devosia pacifica TaxID=1335967 RepID=UPI0016796C8E|nr:CHAD domain-containing protein [Devosia pacifica]